MMKTGDKILIIFMIIVIGFLSFRIYFRSPGSLRADVTLNSEVVQSFSKSELAGEEIYIIGLEKGIAEIEINNGEIRMLPMPVELCPRGICSARGWIKRPGTAIICLPNRLVVQIYGDAKKSRIDAVVR
jgi:hypothetical protein